MTPYEMWWCSVSDTQQNDDNDDNSDDNATQPAYHMERALDAYDIENSDVELQILELNRAAQHINEQANAVRRSCTACGECAGANSTYAIGFRRHAPQIRAASVRRQVQHDECLDLRRQLQQLAINLRH